MPAAAGGDGRRTAARRRRIGVIDIGSNSIRLVVFDGLRRTPIREPVFVIGHARSGTTHLHDLLYRDERRFSSFLMYELVWPALIPKHLVETEVDVERVS